MDNLINNSFKINENFLNFNYDRFNEKFSPFFEKNFFEKFKIKNYKKWWNSDLKNIFEKKKKLLKISNNIFKYLKKLKIFYLKNEIVLNNEKRIKISKNENFEKSFDLFRIFKEKIFQKVSKELISNIKKEKKKYFKNFFNWLNEHTNSNKNFWKYIKSKENKNILNKLNNISLLEMSNFWKPIYKKIDEKEYENKIIYLKKIINEKKNFEEINNYKIKIEEILEKKLYFILKNLPSNKVVGIDLIPYELIKKIIENLDYFLKFKNIIKFLIFQNNFSNYLKKIKMIFIPKIKEIKNPSEFRPISLQNSIIKIIESILLIYFKKELEIKNLNFENQLGFKNKTSTQNNFLKIKLKLNYLNSKNRPIYLISIDIIKAFDSVNHIKLIKKLIEKKNKFKFN